MEEMGEGRATRKGEGQGRPTSLHVLRRAPKHNENPKKASKMGERNSVPLNWERVTFSKAPEGMRATTLKSGAASPMRGTVAMRTGLGKEFE